MSRMRSSILLFLLPALAFAQSAEVLNPDVRQETIRETICVSGYTKSVRPSTSYTNGVKRKLMREAGIDWSRAKEFELDHKINLSIGGHPRNIHNLMLQPWDGKDGAKEKDRVEVRMQKMVCAGAITLQAAQSCMWNDWRKCLLKPARARLQRRSLRRH